MLTPNDEAWQAAATSLWRGAELYLTAQPDRAERLELRSTDASIWQLTTVPPRGGVATRHWALIGLNPAVDAEGWGQLARSPEHVVLLASADGESGLTSLGARHPLGFTLAPTVGQLARPLGEWAQKELATRAYVCAVDDAWGRAAAAAFRDGFTRQRGTVVVEDFTPAGAADFAAALAHVETPRAEVVFAAYRGDDAARFAARYERLNPRRRARLIGIGDIASASSAAALEGVLAAVPWTAQLATAANESFLRAFRERYAAEADFLAVQGHDAAQLVDGAVGLTNGEMRDRARLARALADQEAESPRGRLRFDAATHAITQDIYIVDSKERAGALVPVAIARIPSVRPAM